MSDDQSREQLHTELTHLQQRIATLEAIIEEQSRTLDQLRFQAAILGGVAEIIVAVDHEGKIIYWNDYAEQLYGWSFAEVRGQNLLDITSSPLGRNEAQQALLQVLAGELQSGEVLAQRRNGASLQVLFTAAPLWDESGNLIGAVGVAIDISARKNAELALHASEQRFRTVVETAPVIIILAEDNHIRYVNQSAEQISGYNRSELLTMNFLDIVHPDSRELLREWQRSQSVPHQYACKLISQQGDERRLNLTITLIELDAMPMMLITGYDSTEHNRIIEQLNISLAEKAILLKEIHHRVKNNFQIIASLIDLHADQIIDPQARNLFKDSQHRIKSMALIHEKLYQSPNMAQINVAEYIEELTDYLRRSFGSSNTSVNVHNTLMPLMLDPSLMLPCGLIVHELVSNALKHAFPQMDKGVISIVLSVDKQRNQATLIIADNGIGLPAELDFHNTETLGLQLVVMSTRQLHGTISLERSSGTRFTITFTVPAELSPT